MAQRGGGESSRRNGTSVKGPGKNKETVQVRSDPGTRYS